VHVHLQHLPVPAVLLSVVYAAAIAVALAHPGEHTLGGLVVLAGLVARWALRSRHRATAPVALAVASTVDAVLAPDPAAPSPAAAA
jgi:uncharacterized membrane protein